MILVELIEQVLGGETTTTKAERLLREELRRRTSASQADQALLTRTAIRLVVRYQQFVQSVASAADLLVSIRDFVCFVGRFRAAPAIRCLLEQPEDNPFGLYLDNDEYVNIQPNLPGWQPNSEFMRAVHLKQLGISSILRSSSGDGLLSAATPFSTYRSYEQKLAVHTGLNLPAGHTLLVALSTGAGKSLVTQMVAAYSSGLTLVIVPTVALALDQYRAAREVLRDALDENQIAYYHGQMQKAAAQTMIQNLLAGETRLLFTSPEAVMRNSTLKAAILAAAEQQRISNLVIDEAHIVTDWGALFRPDFQFLSVMRRRLLAGSKGQLRTLLLSATLTEDAVATLEHLFAEGSNWVEMRCDALRPEPRYSLLRCGNEAEKHDHVLRLCLLLPRPMVLYVLSPDDAELWARTLKQAGLRNFAVFTGDTDDSVRDEIIDGWNKERFDLVIASSAFGMGVDKPDVRTVLHACMPESLNRFYQEVGRGGRDGLPSLSVLCVNMAPQGDRAAAFSLVKSRVLRVKTLLGRWTSMQSDTSAFYEGDTVSLDTAVAPNYLDEDQRELTGRRNVQWNLNTILFLCRYGYVDLLDADYDPSRQSYRVRVRLDDLNLVNDPDSLAGQLEVDRQAELDSVTSGYRAMNNLLQKANKECMGDILTELFCYAEPLCGGCMAHIEPDVQHPGFHVQKRVTRVNLDRPARGKLSRLMGAYLDMWVYRSKRALDWQEMTEVAAVMSACGVPVWVVPAEPDSSCTGKFSGLVLTPDEMINTYQYHRSLLERGLFLCFGENDETNQGLFDRAWVLKREGVPVIFLGEDTMCVKSQQRSVRDLIEGYMVSSGDVTQEG